MKVYSSNGAKADAANANVARHEFEEPWHEECPEKEEEDGRPEAQ